MKQRIHILDHHTEVPQVACFFDIDREGKVTCSRLDVIDLLNRDGILVGGKILYPRDGREFFDSLFVRFQGLWAAQPPVAVEDEWPDTEPSRGLLLCGVDTHGRTRNVAMQDRSRLRSLVQRIAFQNWLLWGWSPDGDEVLVTSSYASQRCFYSQAA